MVVHPAPPADVPSLVEAYREVLGTFIGTCDGLRAAEWELDSPCPGWTVRDVVAHVLHVEDYLAGGEHPVSGWTGEGDTVEAGRPVHARHAFGAWAEEGLRARADLSGEELVEQLRGVVEIRSAQMYDPDLELDTPVRSVQGGQLAFGALTRLRISDVWAHGQDIRATVDRPGALDSPGAAIFTAYVLDQVPAAVAEADPAPGTVVIVESTGPVTGRAGVRVVAGADGGTELHPLFTGHVDAEEGTDEAAEEPAVTQVLLSTHELTRRAAGRQSVAGTAYRVEGDEDLAAAVLEALVVTP